MKGVKIQGTKEIKDLWKKYQRGQLDWENGVNLFQYLLDTDQHLEDESLYKTARYLVAEGFCYYVPTEV